MLFSGKNTPFFKGNTLGYVRHLSMKKYLIFLVCILFLGMIYWSVDYALNRSESALEKRATTYWSAFVANDLYTLYEMEAAALEGNLMPHEVGISHSWNVRLVRFEISDPIIYGDRAEVTIDKEITMPDTKTGKTMKNGKIKDPWSLINGRWMHGEHGSTKSILRKIPLPPSGLVWFEHD